MQERKTDNSIQRLPVRAAAVCFWLAVWEIASLSLHSELLLVSPVRALQRFLELLPQPVFRQAVFGSFTKIGLGYLLGMTSAAVLAVLASRRRLLRELLAPAVLAVKSVPVASFIILALIWFSSRRLSIVIPLLMVFPTVYTGVLEGCLQIDPKLEEMADIFAIPHGRRLRYLRAPQIFPYLESSCRLAMGLAWKSGIAAEVIGMPAGTIGSRLQQAKVYLETPDLFAWTMAIVLLSFLMERLFVWILRAAMRLLTRMPVQKQPAVSTTDQAAPGPVSIRLTHLTKHYEGIPVLEDLSVEIPAGSITCLTGPSGIGKTTLLRLLAGLEKADGGSVSTATLSGDSPSVSMVFQENRLMENLPVVSNLRIVAPSLTDTQAAAALRSVDLSDDLLRRPVRTLSGGMKRRVTLLRALLAKRQILLMDEPFTGLDDETRQHILQVLPGMTAGRTVLLVTHDPEDPVRLGAPVIRL